MARRRDAGVYLSADVSKQVGVFDDDLKKRQHGDADAGQDL